MTYIPKTGDIFFNMPDEVGGFRFFEIIEVSDGTVSLREIASEIRPSADPGHPRGTFFSMPQPGRYKSRPYKRRKVCVTGGIPSIMDHEKIVGFLWSGRPLLFSDLETHIVNADERGDFGYKETSSKTMVIAISVVPHSKDFHDIARRYPKNTKGGGAEDVLRFRSSSDAVRAAVIEDIATSDVDIYAATYWKDMSKGPDRTKSGSRIYRGLFEDIINKMMSEIDAASLYFVIDISTYISRDAADRIVRESALKHGKIIMDCIQVGSETELLLQTHDFVVGGLGIMEETGDSSYVKKLKCHIRDWMRREQ